MGRLKKITKIFFHQLKAKRKDNFLMLVLVEENLSKIQSYEFDKLLHGNLIFHKIKLFSLNDWHKNMSINQWDEILQIFVNK